MYDKEAVGRRLRSGMVDKGITTEEMAAKVGISTFSLNDYCSGKTGMTLETAEKICNVLDWPLDRLAVREA